MSGKARYMSGWRHIAFFSEGMAVYSTFVGKILFCTGTGIERRIRKAASGKSFMFSNYEEKNNRGMLRNDYLGSLRAVLTERREWMENERKGVYFISSHSSGLCLSLRPWQKSFKDYTSTAFEPWDCQKSELIVMDVLCSEHAPWVTHTYTHTLTLTLTLLQVWAGHW